ncbi:glycine zipper domain-containing protein [Planctomycetota bacterium]
MGSSHIKVLSTILLMLFVVGCADTEEGAAARRGAQYGAAGGALLGLTLGALTGDAEFAVAGMAAGAAAGAASGAMYEYDQSRDDRRTQTLADALGGAKAGETADDAGKRHLEDFIGSWRLEIWAEGLDGKRITARGKAKCVLESKTTARIDFSDIEAAGFDQEVSGFSLMHYDPAVGFSLENHFAIDQDKLPQRNFVGEYLPAKNSYNYYPTSDTDSKTMGGTLRSHVRLEVRTSGSSLFVAETYILRDIKEEQIQSYRFIKE